MKALGLLSLLVVLSAPSLDDIAYGAGFQFGNAGRLSDTLRTVASEAP